MQTEEIRVLLIEDDAEDAQLVTLALADAGGTRFNVCHAGCLQDGLRLLGDQVFDAVLLDLSLPDSSGTDGLSRLEAVNAGIPIVVLSSLPDDEMALNAVKEGAQDYLVKGRGDGHLIARSLRYAMERKHGEEALRKSERMLEQAQRIAHVGHWMWDIGRGTVTWSAEVYRIFGYRPDSFVPTYELFLASVSPEDRQGVIDTVDVALRTRESYGVEFRIVRADGGVRTIADRAEVECDEMGRPVGMHGTVQDITPYKEVEGALRTARDELEKRVEERTAHLADLNRQLEREIIQRKRTEEILRAERDFSSAVLDTVGALVTVLDSEGRIIRFNRACEETTGYSLAEVRGKPVWEVFLLPDEVPAVRKVFQELRADQIPNKYENHWLTRSGKRRLISWSNTVLSARNRASPHVIATGIDITDRRLAELHERQRMQELAHVSRLSTMGEMATEIAHELNQPLAAIASYSDTGLRILGKSEWREDELREILDEVGGQAHRAGEIIRRLRSFARKNDVQRLSLDINELVRDVAKLVEPEARWHDVDVLLDLGECLPEIVVDRVLIEQVVMNLLRNAIDAMISADSHDRRVLVQTRVNGDGMLEVAVSDTGPGLSADGLQKVFEPFYTTKDSGMGLGLAISQSIIETHAGQLWATSEQGEGATFGFVLPPAINEESEDVT